MKGRIGLEIEPTMLQEIWQIILLLKPWLQLNNPKVKYLLIAAVVVIWGLVIYRIVDGQGQEEYIPPVAAQIIAAAPVQQVDSFELIKDYGKVFDTGYLSYGGASTPTGQKTQPKAVTKPKAKPIVQKVKWPVIQVAGSINNTNSGAGINIFNIAGQEYLLKKGELAREIRFLGIEGDSACFFWREETKCILVR